MTFPKLLAALASSAALVSLMPVAAQAADATPAHAKSHDKKASEPMTDKATKPPVDGAASQPTAKKAAKPGSQSGSAPKP